jgi:DNA polymerase-3 subunit epsilon
VEVAAVVVTEQGIGERWESLVNPGRAIPADATAIHGINDAMVATAPSPSVIAAELRRRCAGATLVFHNAPFDLPFLAALLRQSGQPPLDNPIVDTLGLARGLMGTGGNSLRELASRLGLPAQPRHRALDDATTTAHLFLALARAWQEKEKARTLEELAAESQDVVRLTASR